MRKVFVKFILGVKEVVISRMPIGYVEITLVDGNFTLLESFAETVTVLTADCITEAFCFVGSKRFGEVAIDLAVKSATVFRF